MEDVRGSITTIMPQTAGLATTYDKADMSLMSAALGFSHQSSKEVSMKMYRKQMTTVHGEKPNERDPNNGR